MLPGGTRRFNSSSADQPIIIGDILFETIEALEDALTPQLFERLSLPWEAAFLAGKSFLSYRKRGGRKTTPLPDFYIGAHAAVANLTLLTRDATRYKTYFPKLRLVAP